MPALRDPESLHEPEDILRFLRSKPENRSDRNRDRIGVPPENRSPDRSVKILIVVRIYLCKKHLVKFSLLESSPCFFLKFHPGGIHDSSVLKGEFPDLVNIRIFLDGLPVQRPYRPGQVATGIVLFDLPGNRRCKQAVPE